MLFSLNISPQSIYIAKEKPSGFITVIARKVSAKDIEIEHATPDGIRLMITTRKGIGQFIAGLLGEKDVAHVTTILRGVA